MYRACGIILCPHVSVTLVIDYLSGARRGERQTFNELDRVSFGRHPDNMVVFDAQADIDASSRHAELVSEGQNYLLRDIGSSNGTWISGERVQERSLSLEEPVEVEFGHGGPVLRLWLGADQSRAPSIVPRRQGWRRFLPW